LDRARPPGWRRIGCALHTFLLWRRHPWGPPSAAISAVGVPLALRFGGSALESAGLRPSLTPAIRQAISAVGVPLAP
jgi:hypothetical protein